MTIEMIDGRSTIHECKCEDATPCEDDCTCNHKGLSPVTVRKQISEETRLKLRESHIGIQKGDKNPCWKGDSVSYGGLHKWVSRNIPKPEVCSKCGKAPGTGRIEAHNISGKYTRDITDWEWICTKCHQKTDGRDEKIKKMGQLSVASPKLKQIIKRMQESRGAS